MSVRDLLIFVLFACFFFQPECPLCREPVQLSRLVFLHHYEPTWPTTETHFDTVYWEAFKYNQSSCRQLWAVRVPDAWVDARVACLLKYWWFKTPTNCSENTSHSRDSFHELGLRSLQENLEPGNKAVCTEKQSTVKSSRLYQPWTNRLYQPVVIAVRCMSKDLSILRPEISQPICKANKQNQKSVGY